MLKALYYDDSIGTGFDSLSLCVCVAALPAPRFPLRVIGLFSPAHSMPVITATPESQTNDKSGLLQTAPAYLRFKGCFVIHTSDCTPPSTLLAGCKPRYHGSLGKYLFLLFHVRSREKSAVHDRALKVRGT